MAGPTISEEMMESPWHLVDLTQVKGTLKELEELLLCSRCGKLPARGGGNLSFPLVSLVTTCGHSICGSNPACGPSFAGGGPCPVKGCGIHASPKDIRPDLDQTSRIEAVIGLRSTMDLEENEDCRMRELANDVEEEVQMKSTTVKRGKKKKPEADVPPNSTSISSTTVKMAKTEDNSSCRKRGKRSIPVEKKSLDSRDDPRTFSKTKNVNKRNAKGETLLHCACRKLEEEKVMSLLREGAETNTQDYAGWTPLHEVAQRSHYRLVSLLLDHGVNPNVPGGDDNFTPLHDAVQAGNPDVVRILIEKGARKDVRDAAGNTPRNLTSNPAVLRVLDKTVCKLTEDELNQTLMGNSAVESNSLSSTRCHVINLDQMSSKNDPTKIDLLKGLEKIKQRQSKSFAVEHKSTKLNPNLTHLVVVGVNDANQVEVDGETRLSSYYEALMLGSWIVNFRWVSESVQARRLLAEDDYEVTGICRQARGAPEKARLTRMKKLPKLLDGMHIFLYGSFTKPYPDKAQLVEILKKGGASVLKREPDPEAISTNIRKLPYHADPQGPLSKCSHFIVYQEGTKGEPLIKYKMYHIKTLPAAWLFECLDNYKLVDPFA